MLDAIFLFINFSGGTSQNDTDTNTWDHRTPVTISISLPNFILFFYYLFAVEHLELSEIGCEATKKE